MDEMTYERAHQWMAEQEGADKPAPQAEPEDEMPAPVVNAVKSAYDKERDEDAKAFSEAFNAEASPVVDSKVEAAELAPMKEVKPMKFGDAFKAAKAEGKKVFDFNGKKYTTDLAKSKTKPAVTKEITPAPEVEPEVKPAAPVAKEDKSIYDDNTFPKNLINKVKSKMNDRANVPKTLPNGKPNLTAA